MMGSVTCGIQTTTDSEKRRLNVWFSEAGVGKLDEDGKGTHFQL